MCAQVLSLMVGGAMALGGRISPEQLTTFVLYVEFVTAASLSVCDQWGGIMESIGASERVMDYLDRGAAPQLSPGRTLPGFSGRVRPPLSVFSLLIFVCMLHADYDDQIQHLVSYRCMKQV